MLSLAMKPKIQKWETKHKIAIDGEVCGIAGTKIKLSTVLIDDNRY